MALVVRVVLAVPVSPSLDPRSHPSTTISMDPLRPDHGVVEGALAPAVLAAPALHLVTCPTRLLRAGTLLPRASSLGLVVLVALDRGIRTSRTPPTCPVHRCHPVRTRTRSLERLLSARRERRRNKALVDSLVSRSLLLSRSPLAKVDPSRKRRQTRDPRSPPSRRLPRRLLPRKSRLLVPSLCPRDRRTTVSLR